MKRPSPGGSCLILLGGVVPNPALVRRAARRCREIICADGAVGRAEKIGLKADFVVGDMDSLPHPLRLRNRPVFWCDFDEERSDFQKCLEFARGRGLRRAFVSGALGGRLDHSLFNLALMERAAGLEIVFLDEGIGRVLVPGRYSFSLRRGEAFSILALPLVEVSLSGCRYPLERTVLERNSRGLSNQAAGRVRLELHRGRAWFFSARSSL